MTVFTSFQKASELARSRGLPRIYISANSGARIGLAEEIKHLYRVAWEDPHDPDKVCVLTLSQTTNLYASKPKEFADDNFKFDENVKVLQMGKKYCGKWRNSSLPTVFSKALY